MMLIQEYLKQGRLLDQKINYNLQRLYEMRQNISNISAPDLSASKVQTSHDSDAPYVSLLMQIEEMQERIDRETDLLVALRNQIDEVIRDVGSDRHQMLLIYRYMKGMSWEQIGTKLNAGKSTIKRWHNEALQMIKLPEEPIFIRGLHKT